MEMKQMDAHQKELTSKVIDHINTVMGYLDLYEPNRPASIAVTKLEEAVMWAQVMIANCKMKEVKEPQEPETQVVEGELITAK